MRFLIDAQLPPALADYLIGLGHDAVHVNDFGLGVASDRSIWRHAAAQRVVIVTKDQDFAELTRIEGDGPAVVWIRLGNTTRAALLAAIDPLMPEILGALERGERLIEVA